MKKFLKSSFSVFLAITIVFSSAIVGLNELDFSGIKFENPFAVESMAATSGTTGDCTWSLDGTVLTISGNGEMDDYWYNDKYQKPTHPWGISITKVVFENNVTSIGEYAFAGCEKLTSIDVPDSVTTICDRAFYLCTNLMTITIPDSVISIHSSAFETTKYYNDDNNWDNYVLYIGNHLIKAQSDYLSGDYEIKSGTKTIANKAFDSCTSVTSIKFPDSLTSIGAGALSWCTRLKAIEIPNSVTTISAGAFEWCKRVTTITISDSVTSIGGRAFYKCEKLTSIVIPDGVTSIGDSTFRYCSLLSSIKIPDSVTSIGGDAFRDCCSLSSITIPDGVTSIESGTFRSCSRLTSIVISDSVTSIGDYAFAGCSKLGTVKIGKNVKTIGEEAFSSSGVKNVYIYDLNSWCNIAFDYREHYDVEYNEYRYYYRANPLYQGANLYLNDELVTNLVVPCSVKAYAFMGCSSIVNVEFLEGVMYISELAFWNCSKLESVIINDSETYMAATAFNGCVDFTIYAPKDSYAQGYANSHGIRFVEACAEHTLSDWAIDKNPTCSEEGAQFKYCTMCGVTLETEVIAKKAHTANDWIIDEEATVYKAGSKHKECTVCGESFSNKTIAQQKCAKPVLKKVYNENSYVKITWGTVKGADKYYVYRKTGTGDYKYIGSTTNKYFNDTKAGAGKTCRYIVKAKNEAGYSKASDSKAVKHIYEPKLKIISNTEYGVKITWGKVTGAEKYSVYRKVSGGEYKYIGATSKTYYTDKTAKSGTKYYYAIRAKRDDSISSQSASLSKYYLADPTLKTISNTEYGVLVKWGKVSGAEKYYIYRKTSSGSYSKIGTTSKTYYTNKKAKSGTKYYYIVKAVKSSTTSASSNVKSILHLAEPTLKTPSSTKSGVKLAWSKVTGAEGYVIYRKTGSGSYTKLKTEKGVSNLSYTDLSAKKGKKYTYKVKAYYSKTYSAYSNTKTITDKY